MTVKIKKQELLDVVKANLAKHKEIVEEAFAKYREQAIVELDSMIAEAKAGKRIRRYVNLVEPVDQTPEYTKAIRQIEMSAEDLIELADQEFKCYVLDQWHWKASFTTANAMYSAKALEG
jgi:hypothetical protein